MNAKSIYRLFLNLSAKTIGSAKTKQLDAKIRFGREINLKNPTTLADKLCWMELFQDNPLKVRCSDKYEVRRYIEEKGLGGILVPLCGGPYYDTYSIDWDALPNQFAMKAAHGCGMNLICEDKSHLDIDEAKTKVSYWLKHDYGRACIEPHYKKIKHSVICEEFLEDMETIKDYKFHCFHGQPEFVLVCSSRKSGLKLNLYDLDWNPIDELVGDEKGIVDIPKPSMLKEMIAISKTLSKGFDFVRVDLYEVNNKIYFGELTFSPATGVLPYFSEKFLKDMGEKLMIHLEG